MLMGCRRGDVFFHVVARVVAQAAVAAMSYGEGAGPCPVTAFIRSCNDKLLGARVILPGKLPCTLRMGRSQLLYFLLGALADVIAAGFRVDSIGCEQLHSSLGVL
jgi:hypothetical protein